MNEAVEEIVLKRMKITALASFSQEILDSMRCDSSLHVEYITDALTVRLIASVYTEDIETETVIGTVCYPATWWQHFRQTYFPKWWLRRYPVRMTTVTKRADVTKFAAYPKLAMKAPSHSPYDVGPVCFHYRVDRHKDGWENPCG